MPSASPWDKLRRHVLSPKAKAPPLNTPIPIPASARAPTTPPRPASTLNPHRQLQSTFFGKLPAELRIQVYELIFEPHHVHLGFRDPYKAVAARPGKFKVYPCVDNPDITPWHAHQCWYREKRIERRATGRRTRAALLYACRLSYHEAGPYLYEQTTLSLWHKHGGYGVRPGARAISTESPPSVLLLLPARVPGAHLHAVRELELVVAAMRRLESGLGAELGRVREGLAALRGLKVVRVYVDLSTAYVYPKEAWAGVEEEILAPFRALWSEAAKRLEALEVYLPVNPRFLSEDAAEGDGLKVVCVEHPAFRPYEEWPDDR